MVAGAGIVAAATLAPPDLPAQVLLVALAAAPLGALLVARTRSGGTALTVGGCLLVGVGIVTAVATDALHGFRLGFSPDQLATSAATTLAPVGLAVVGVGLVVAGLAALRRDRVLGVAAAVIAVAACAADALAMAGLAVAALPYRGGTVSPSPIVAAVVLGVAALLTVVVAVRWSRTTPTATAPAPRPAPTRRTGRWVVLGVLGLLAAGGGWAAYAQFGDRLDLAELVPDPALAACVRSAAGAGADGPVSERQLRGVLSLACNGDLTHAGRVRSLNGLAALPNLVALDLSNNEVADLAELARVPRLTSLELTHNAVHDLGPLAGLASLQELGLSGNRITDLAPLAGLGRLRALGVADNAVSDAGPLAHLAALTEVDLSDNRITDVSPLAALPELDRLRLAGNQVADPGPLRRSIALSVLDVSGNRITDAATLAGCRGVDELWLGANPLTDLRPLLAMPALTGVDLSGSDSGRLVGVESLRARGVYVGGLA